MTLLTMRLMQSHKTLEGAAEAAWLEASGCGWNAPAFAKAARELDAMVEPTPRKALAMSRAEMQRAANEIRAREDYPPSFCWHMPGRTYK